MGPSQVSSAPGHEPCTQTERKWSAKGLRPFTISPKIQWGSPRALRWPSPVWAARPDDPRRQLSCCNLLPLPPLPRLLRSLLTEVPRAFFLGAGLPQSWNQGPGKGPRNGKARPSKIRAPVPGVGGFPMAFHRKNGARYVHVCFRSQWPAAAQPTCLMGVPPAYTCANTLFPLLVLLLLCDAGWQCHQRVDASF